MRAKAAEEWNRAGEDLNEAYHRKLRALIEQKKASIESNGKEGDRIGKLKEIIDKERGNMKTNSSNPRFSPSLYLSLSCNIFFSIESNDAFLLSICSLLSQFNFYFCSLYL